MRPEPDAAGDGARAHRALIAAMLACFGAGSVLMLLFEAPLTRIAGVLLLLAFMVCGVFVVASPAFLAADDEP